MMKQSLTISYGIPLPYDWNSYMLMDALIDFSQRKMKGDRPTKYWQQYKSNANRLLQWKEILQQKSDKSLAFSWQQQTQFVPFPRIFVEQEQETMEQFQQPISISLQGFCKQGDTLAYLHQFSNQTPEDIIHLWKKQIHAEMQYAIVIDRLHYTNTSQTSATNMILIPPEKLYEKEKEEVQEQQEKTPTTATNKENPLLKPCLILKQYEKEILSKAYEEFVLQNSTIHQAHQEWIKKQMEMRRKMVHSQLKAPEPSFFTGIQIQES